MIADTCFKAGYIDSWGRGTIKIIEACKESGLPEPVLREEQGGFLSKIFKDRFTKDQLKKAGFNERQMKAVEYVKKNGKITNSYYQKLCEVSGGPSDESMLNYTRRTTSYVLIDGFL